MGLAEKQNDEITQYLLGELSAEARAALEEKYFDDDELFTRFTERENDLIADYQHNRLSPAQRQLFEQNYLAHPGRQAHVGFIKALTQTLAPAKAAPPWERWRAFCLAWKSPLAFAASAAAVLLLVGSLWLWQENRQLREGLQQAQQAQNNSTQHTQDLQQQLRAQQHRSDELAAEIKQLRKPGISTTPQLGTTIISLLLAASGNRTSESGRPPELQLTPDTKQVRLRLKLKKNEYARYQAVLEQVGGQMVLTQRNLKAQGLFVDVLVPAHKFAAGDYLLNLAGVTASGETEDLAKPFFRVLKR